MTWMQIVENFQKPLTSVCMPVSRTHKRCLGCEKMLPFSSYYVKGESGHLVSRCKPCYMARQKKRKA
jgi:hypothetical protein